MASMMNAWEFSADDARKRAYDADAWWQEAAVLGALPRYIVLELETDTVYTYTYMIT